MLVGNGMLARGFNSYESDNSILIFASGVSNSKECLAENFDRERKLLLSTYDEHRSMQLIYFSSCSIMDKTLADSPYVRHKLDMEGIVSSFEKYSIFRLPQLIGLANNQTIINYFYTKIIRQDEFDLLVDSKRNLIDITDVYKIVDYLICHGLCLNKTIPIATPFYISVIEIVQILEKVTQKKAKYNILKTGSSYEIDIEWIMQFKTIKNILKSYNYRYISDAIRKYYGFGQ